MYGRHTPPHPLPSHAVSLAALCLLVGCASSGPPIDTEVAMDGAETAQDAPPRVEAQGGGDDPVNAAETPTPSACSAPAPTATRWYDDAVGYEIFVRSFRDSDGDGIGDLAGLTASLDYLNDGDPETTDDLGVTLLWLMPIHQSPSYHGYDVTDYDRVDVEYGTEDELTAMLEAAEARGIRVIIDLVLNHSSSQHPWFIDAETGPSATYRNFYVWSDNDPGWSQPWSGNGTWHPTPSGYYYGLFWGGMPDLNFASEAVQATMTQVARDWLGRGVAGYRLDAVRYLVETGGGDGQKDTDETLAYWRRLREATDNVDTDTLLLGEAWADSSIVSAYFGDEDKPAMHMAFDFETASGLETALVTGQGVALKSALCARLDGWPNHGRAGTFATNHDMRRLASRLKGAGPGALHLIAAALMTLPGTPWLYYGQELGLLNGPTQDDIDKRLPMQWHDGPGGGFTEGTAWAAPQSLALADSVAGQTNDPGSLLSRYRDLIALRAAHPALRRGSMRMLSPETSTGSAVAFYRELGDEQLLVLLNPTESEVTVTLTEEMLGGDHRFSHAHGAPAATPQAALDITKGVTLSGFGYRVLIAARAE